jgi:hypothetical protein
MPISISSSDFLNGYDNLIREDGMINATLLCKAGKKLLSNYNQNKQTQLFLQSLSIETGIPIIELFVTTAGKYGGTWVHHLVATHLAQWISIEFSIKVSLWIDKWKSIHNENKKEYEDSLLNIKADKNNLNREKEIQTKLSQELGGEIEVETEFGFIDILTEDELIEIKIGHDWKCGIGQLLTYGEYYKDHVKRLHLFDFKYDKKIAKICEKYNIKLSYEIITPL